MLKKQEQNWDKDSSDQSQGRGGVSAFIVLECKSEELAVGMGQIQERLMD